MEFLGSRVCCAMGTVKVVCKNKYTRFQNRKKNRFQYSIVKFCTIFTKKFIYKTNLIGNSVKRDISYSQRNIKLYTFVRICRGTKQDPQMFSMICSRQYNTFFSLFDDLGAPMVNTGGVDMEFDCR